MQQPDPFEEMLTLSKHSDMSWQRWERRMALPAWDAIGICVRSYSLFDATTELSHPEHTKGLRQNNLRDFGMRLTGQQPEIWLTYSDASPKGEARHFPFQLVVPT